MPTLRQLLEELRKLTVDPDDVRVPAQLYDDLIEQAEDTVEENPGGVVVAVASNPSRLSLTSGLSL